MFFLFVFCFFFKGRDINTADTWHGLIHKCLRGRLVGSERDADPKEGRAERQKAWALAGVTNCPSVPETDSFLWSVDTSGLKLKTSQIGLHSHPR